MALVLTTDAMQFSDRARTFLAADIERNVLATVLMSVLGGHYREVEPLFGYECNSAGAVVAAALRTPPLPLITSRLDPETIEPMLAAWLEFDPALPGAGGPSETARGLAEAWSRRTGGHVERMRTMAMHSLRAVNDPPRPARGRLRRGEVSERQLLIAWWKAFAAEAGGYGGNAAANVDARLATESIFLWDDDGPVSVVAISPAVAGVVRIGPVYTPPDRRGNGYAAMAVAEVSRHALASAAHTCMLFTDLANPTSNKIYAEVGYRRFAGWDEYAYASGAGSA